MPEFSGITELQLLETEVACLETTLQKVQKAEKTSKACARVRAVMKEAELKDSFVITEGAEPNQFHSSAGQGADGGCCAVL